jgi:hypothetical protein
MSRANIPDGKAQKIKRAHAKVVAHRADQAGSLRTIFQSLGGLVKLLADCQGEVDEAVQNEIKILFHVISHFSKRIRVLSTAKAGALRKALVDIEKIERQLKVATGPAYGVKRLIAESQRDLAHTQKLHANLQMRYREAAFVLAELEQAVDPVSDLQLSTAAQRKRNDKVRKVEPVAPKPDTMTS